MKTNMIIGVIFIWLAFVFYSPKLMSSGTNVGGSIVDYIITMFILLPPTLLILFLLNPLEINYPNPFSSTERLIHVFYPQEEFVNKKRIFDIDFGIGKLRGFPVGIGFIFNILIPAKLIETKTTYYIDRRIQTLISGLIWTPIYLIIMYIMYQLGILTKIEQNFFLTFVGLICIITIGLTFFFSIITGINRIELIKKSWIRKTEKRGVFLFISGTIPENETVILNSNTFLKTGGYSEEFKKIIFPAANIKIKLL